MIKGVEIPALYIFSQILVIVYYALGALTYQLHDRKRNLIYNLISLFAVGLSYFCLSAYSGVAMTFVGIIRNLMIFLRRIIVIK